MKGQFHVVLVTGPTGVLEQTPPGRSADEKVAPARLELKRPRDGAESSEGEGEKVGLVGCVAHGDYLGVGADATGLVVASGHVVHHVLFRQPDWDTPVVEWADNVGLSHPQFVGFDVYAIACKNQ